MRSAGDAREARHGGMEGSASVKAPRLGHAPRVVGVGIATIDVIQEVDAYPEEDAKIRALTSRRSRGGNVANALVVAAQLGCQCSWIGTTTDPATDSDAAFVKTDLEAVGVDTSTATIIPHGAMPVSYILSSRATGSRTIIHHRDLPELSIAAFSDRVHELRSRSQLDAEHSTWFHFEGRNLDNVEAMMTLVRKDAPHSVISMEIEALRHDWDQLRRMALLADVVFVSKEYVRKKLLHMTATAFLNEMMHDTSFSDWKGTAIICPWGEAGVYYLNAATKNQHHVPTTPLSPVVDAVGAGDSFIGASIAALARDVPLNQALAFACQVATRKCKQQGFTFSQDVLEAFHKQLA